MYGLVKPFVPELKVKEDNFYKSIYCGLCRSMKKHTGGISPVTLSYDMVFFALVRITLDDDMPKVNLRRCIVHPLKKRPTACDLPALEYTARASALLFEAKVGDDALDEKGLKKLFFGLLKPYAKRMRRRAMIDDLHRKVAEGMQDLRKTEAEGCGQPDKPADIFGRILAALGSAGLDEKKSAIAEEIFFHTGRFVYLADAAKDYECDTKEGKYNPFALAFESEKEVLAFFSDGLSDILTLELCAIERAVNLIDAPRTQIALSCIENIIHSGMQSTAFDIIAEKKRSKV